MNSAKRKELLLSLLGIVVLVSAVFWFFPSIWRPSGPHQTAMEKFEYLLIGNHYGKLSLDRYDNFRLMSFGGDSKVLTAIFQIPQSVPEAKAVFRQYLDINKYTAIREQSIEGGGVQLFAQLYDQPLVIEITKISSQVSKIAFTFQEKYLIQKLSYGQLPSKFPNDLPVEYDAGIINNESVKINGKTQGTLIIQSANTPEENFEIYRNYFGRGDWKISGQVDDAKLPVKAILASNQTGTMSLNISPSQSAGASIVSLIFLTSPR